VRIKASGEVEFTFEGRKLVFAPTDVGGYAARKALGYFSPNDPQFLHVTDGKGAIVGTWYRRERVAHADHEALSQAMRYTAHALKAAQEETARLLAPEREQLEEMREHNAELEKAAEFIEITQAPSSTIQHPSPVAAGLLTAKQKVKREKIERSEEFEEGRAALRAASEMY
jgi:Mg/Co/Ni transporter MgtE